VADGVALRGRRRGRVQVIGHQHRHALAIEELEAEDFLHLAVTQQVAAGGIGQRCALQQGLQFVHRTGGELRPGAGDMLGIQPQQLGRRSPDQPGQRQPGDRHRRDEQQHARPQRRAARWAKRRGRQHVSSRHAEKTRHAPGRRPGSKGFIGGGGDAARRRCEIGQTAGSG
jgi:hypothetical protein